MAIADNFMKRVSVIPKEGEKGTSGAFEKLQGKFLRKIWKLREKDEIFFDFFKGI